MAAEAGRRRREEGFTAAAGGVLSQIGGSLYAVGTHTISYFHTHTYIHTYIHTLSDTIPNINFTHTYFGVHYTFHI